MEERRRRTRRRTRRRRGRRRRRRAMGGWKEGTAGAALGCPQLTRMQKTLF